MQLKLFPEREAWLLYEVYGFSAEVSYDLVYDRQRLQLVVDYGELVLGTQDL